MKKTIPLKSLLLILLTLLVVKASYAQQNFVPGYIIQTNGDTVRGLIDFRDWGISPEKVKFKKDNVSEPITLRPGHISGFMVQDLIYISAIVDIDVSPMTVENLDFNNNPLIMEDTAFIQILFRGEKNLYYHKSADRREYFYIGKEGDYELLIWKKYLIHEAGRDYATENKEYIHQLTEYLNSSEEEKKLIKEATYKLNSLIKIFDRYYNNNPTEPIYSKRRDKLSTNLGLFAGVSVTDLSFSSKSFGNLTNADFSLSKNFSGGLFFDIILNKFQGKWSLSNELIYTTYNVTGEYLDYTSADDYSITTTELGFSYIKINNMLRFSYPVGKLSFFINGGISNGYAFDVTNCQNKEVKFYTTDRTEEGIAIESIRKYEQGYLLGAGIKYGKVALQFRYEYGNGMSEYISLNSKTKRYFGLLSYSF